jgi:carbamoyl-phosphate synthase large subunit
MAGESLADTLSAYGRAPTTRKLNHIAVKEAVFPFARFPGVDTVLGPEMRSTGEVMGLDRDYALAFAKAQLGAGNELPRSGTVFVSVRDEDKPRVVEAVRILSDNGFKIMATAGTADYLGEQGFTVDRVNKVMEGRPGRQPLRRQGDRRTQGRKPRGASAAELFLRAEPVMG